MVLLHAVHRGGNETQSRRVTCPRHTADLGLKTPAAASAVPAWAGQSLSEPVSSLERMVQTLPMQLGGRQQGGPAWGRRRCPRPCLPPERGKVVVQTSW